MIVVLEDPPKRANSKKLNLLFRAERERCEENGSSYCVEPIPGSKPRPLENAEKRVCVKLNERVKSQMSDNSKGEGFMGSELRSASSD